MGSGLGLGLGLGLLHAQRVHGCAQRVHGCARATDRPFDAGDEREHVEVHGVVREDIPAAHHHGDEGDDAARVRVRVRARSMHAACAEHVHGMHFACARHGMHAPRRECEVVRREAARQLHARLVLEAAALLVPLAHLVGVGAAAGARVSPS